MQDDTSWPSSGEAGYVLAVLMLAYILSFVDRNVLAILVGPIRAEFAITDFQFSLLHGTAFTLFYVLLGVPFGWLADRYDRRRIILGGVAFWSLMTALCGFARGFASLFAFRVGVGVGEATLSPAAYSLLGDCFPPGRLRWATSIFAMGITLGTGISYLVGGWLYEYFAALASQGGGIPYGLSAWQATFVVVGASGVLVLGLLFFVREPLRRGDTREEPPAFAETLAWLRANRRCCTSLMLGVSLLAVIGYGSMAWYPEMLLRTHGMPKGEAGSALGLVFMLAGTLGCLCGAFFASALARRGHVDANMRWVMIAAWLAALPALAAPLMPDARATLALFALVTFLHYSHFGVAMAALNLVSPVRMRGQVSAIMLFCTNLLGLGLGATLVAALTDFVFREDVALAQSLALASAVCYPAAALLLGTGLAAYRRALPAPARVD